MTVLLGAEGVEVVREAPGTVAGETLDALEQALTEEERAPLPARQQVLRLIGHRPRQVGKARARLPVRSVPSSGGVAGLGRRRPGSAGPEEG